MTMPKRFERFLEENIITEIKPHGEMLYEGMLGFNLKTYPAWRYNKILDGIIVKNTDEDEEAKLKGYEQIISPIMSNRQLINWFWDLEDMSPRQLVVFAKEEYGIDLPVDAGQERLQKAIFELGKFNPKNDGRLVFMAHEIKMDYDGVLKEIRGMAETGMSEIVTEVIEL